MLLMIIDVVDFIYQRKLTLAVATIIVILLSVSPFVQAHQSYFATNSGPATTNQTWSPSVYDNSNVVSNAFLDLGDRFGHLAASLRTGLIYGVIQSTLGITSAEKIVVDSVYLGVIYSTDRLWSRVIVTSKFGLDLFELIGSVRLPSNMSNLGVLIRPRDPVPTPTITQKQAQQASIIQSGTLNVSLPLIGYGEGGACDNGEGNGGYPAIWCNAPMDTLPTSFVSSSINRECTSYALWYFTEVEGNLDFRVSGDAKYWASSSNYPTHLSPAIGAIAVETTGAYGHVAIVQALPGQKYSDGTVVPAGYILVSEMNYDWRGHFRYSFSPLSKFRAYIYQ